MPARSDAIPETPSRTGKEGHTRVKCHDWTSTAFISFSRVQRPFLASILRFAPHQMKDPAELAVGVSSAGFEFDRSCRRHLL